MSVTTFERNKQRRRRRKNERGSGEKQQGTMARPDLLEEIVDEQENREYMSQEVSI